MIHLSSTQLQNKTAIKQGITAMISIVQLGLHIQAAMSGLFLMTIITVFNILTVIRMSGGMNMIFLEIRLRLLILWGM